jgi:hypothetical protein
MLAMLRLAAEGRNTNRGIEIEHQYRSSSRIRRTKSPADSDCIGITSVSACNADGSMRRRCVSTAVSSATGLPRRLIACRGLLDRFAPLLQRD